MSAYIATMSGKVLDLLDPDMDLISIEEIATSLARECRFHNQTAVNYSVAQHCLEVSALCSTWEGKMWGLLHDAGEAYYGDLCSPLKQHPTVAGMWNYMEGLWIRRFAAKYSLKLPMPDEVKSADILMLVIERKALLPATETMDDLFRSYELGIRAPMRMLGVMTQTEAGLRYVKTFHQLLAQRPQ